MDKAGVLRIDCEVLGERRVMVLASVDVDMRLRKLRSQQKQGKLTTGFVTFCDGDTQKLTFSEVGRCIKGSEGAFATATRHKLGVEGYAVWGDTKALEVVVSDAKHGAWIAAGVKAIEAGMGVEELKKLIEKGAEKGPFKDAIEIKIERPKGIQLSLL